MNRRMFLKTATGSVVAMPLLTSLQPAHAKGSDRCVRFVAIASGHGGVWGEKQWPEDAWLTETADVGHTVRRGDLRVREQSGQMVLSQVLNAPSSLLTEGMLAQMNLIRGLDVPFYLSHHTGGHLGNFGRNDTEYEIANPLPYHPTIDQIMAWSSGFYPSLAGVVRRSVHAGHPLSWGYSNPSDPLNSSVDESPTTQSSLELFRSLFGSFDEPDEPPRLVVDKVMAHYQAIRDGAFGPARRLSAGDRARLDAHMERLFEVERRLNAVVSCGEIDEPTQSTDWHPGRPWGESNDVVDQFAYQDLWNEVLALGLICGATRIATYGCYHNFDPYAGDWHQEVAHEAWVSEVAVDRCATSQQRVFEHVMLDLAQRLDVPDADGNTVLHNTLLHWSQESGPATHESISTPVITLGSAGGAIRTGSYLDYRNRESRAFGQGETNPVMAAQRPGLLYGQYLATVLHAMGVQPSEWRIAGNAGFGVHHNERGDAYPRYVEAMAEDWLPWLQG